MNTCEFDLVVARRRRVHLPVVMGFFLFAAGCSADTLAESAVPTPAPASADSSATAVASPSAGESHGGIPLPDEAVPLEAGTWVARLGPSYPDILLDLPDGWHSYSRAWVSNGAEWPDLAGLTIWVVNDVYAHPCQWDQPRITPGPSAEDLAEVLSARPLREATQPEDVEIDGFHGKYLQWSVPRDIDFATCDEHYFESWRGIAGGSDRYQQGPGQVDELWIVDAGEDRVVFDVTYHPDRVDPAAVEELRAAVEGARFVGVDDGS
jgi:hypothetical protein